MDFVQIADLRTKKRLDVPGVDGGWVEIYTDVTGDFANKAQELGKDPTNSEAVGYMLLEHVIADWNFGDGQGKLAISYASIQSLPSKIIKWLVDASGEALSLAQEAHQEEKKESPAS